VCNLIVEIDSNHPIKVEKAKVIVERKQISSPESKVEAIGQGGKKPVEWLDRLNHRTEGVIEGDSGRPRRYESEAARLH